MVVSIVMGLPLVIIHFLMGFSLRYTIHSWGVPPLSGGDDGSRGSIPSTSSRLCGSSFSSWSAPQNVAGWVIFEHRKGASAYNWLGNFIPDP